MKPLLRSHHSSLSGLILLALLLAATPAYPGSATWDLLPTSANWNKAANWTPAQIPNGPNDVATFGVSDITNISVAAATATEVDSVVFEPGASSYTITNSFPTASFAISGAGVINNSGVPQNFLTPSAVVGPPNATITFENSASAGDQTIFTNAGSAGPGGGLLQFLQTSRAGNATIINNGGVAAANGGTTNFHDNSTAANGIFINHSGEVQGAFGGELRFLNNSTADHGTFTVEGGNGSGGLGGEIQFSDTATAAHGNFTLNGGAVAGGSGGHIEFYFNSTAGDAVLVANNGPPRTEPAAILFFVDSTGGAAQVNVFGTGQLFIGAHNLPGVGIGSLAGDGVVALGYRGNPNRGRNLTVGSNNLSTTLRARSLIEEAALSPR